MNIFAIFITIAGLGLFETVTSVDNAIVNAEVLSTMKPKARRWFLFWGLLFGVFVVRGLLPLLIVYFVAPQKGLWGALTATISGDVATAHLIEASAPYLLMGGGVF